MGWYQIKQSVRLGDKKGVKGKDYKKGVRELPEDIESDPTFLQYVKCGWIVDAEKPSAPVAVNSAEAAKKTLARIKAQAEEKAKPSPAVAHESAKKTLADAREEKKSKAVEEAEEHKDAEPEKKKSKKG